MYFCNMTRKPKIIQFAFSTDDTYKERYMVVVEIVEGKYPKIHIVPVPSWLVFYSEDYLYYCINLN